MPTAEARELQTMPDQAGVRIGPEEIRGYLEGLSARGRSRGTVQIYAARLRALYDGLPPDKRIAPGTLAAWRQALLERGYSPGTVNTHLSAANGLLDYLGRRDLQLMGQLEADSAASQPELTRVEYLRLLQAARTLGRERTYLLVKVFALTGIRVRELPQVTVEAVRRQGLAAGPVFVTRNRRTMSRTQVTAEVQALGRDARVEEAKCTPRCLRKLYQAAQADIERSVRLLAEQTYQRMLDAEQLSAGWEA